LTPLHFKGLKQAGRKPGNKLQALLHSRKACQKRNKTEGLLSLTAQHSTCEMWNAHPCCCGGRCL